ncbi:signal peptidase II [Rubrivirga sp. S365]|uniref:Lipoprotein signal peptidase n=1 Tax=Rubrivirga litoralis TaxID=3075598 RepID=A0ABU3BT66_9BACT|nr:MULTISPECIES: signal peptidase II [unclassified Rubrivirga]MDT0632477.1 signal peptidase II [Rubrivirga sp. F394]MDT7857977.1 signal peptidase II [Rubrivirga sp. S365]
MRVLWISFAIVVFDQITKVVVKTQMAYGDSIPVVGRLFRFTFTENPGMAFGLTVGSKMFLTIFSVVATVLIFVYLRHVRWAPTGYRVALALVLGGAFGNVIDRVFYGSIWGECAPSPPGSSRLLYGCVVDFIHLDVWRGVIPEAVPFMGGKYVALFPIGNIADVAIIAGVVLILITQGAFHEAALRHEADRRATNAAGGPPAGGVEAAPPGETVG